ncbi:hypothetical protein LSAT2_019687, partial [Lamellibrachia satsuma]
MSLKLTGLSKLREPPSILASVSAGRGQRNGSRRCGGRNTMKTTPPKRARRKRKPMTVPAMAPPLRPPAIRLGRGWRYAVGDS